MFISHKATVELFIVHKNSNFTKIGRTTLCFKLLSHRYVSLTQYIFDRSLSTKRTNDQFFPPNAFIGKKSCQSNRHVCRSPPTRIIANIVDLRSTVQAYVGRNTTMQTALRPERFSLVEATRFLVPSDRYPCKQAAERHSEPTPFFPRGPRKNRGGSLRYPRASNV